MLDRVRLWIRSVLLRRRLEREMHEEMSEHLERATARLVARGLSEDEARHQALREFGNVAWLQERAREARGTAWLDALVADLRFALRHFRRTPGTTVVMLVVLALGMSVSTVLFTIVHSYAVQPPPGVARSDDLVRIRGSQDWGVNGRFVRSFTEDELRGYQRLTRQFAAVAGWTRRPVELDVEREGGERKVDARGVFVTPNYFSVLGIRLALGPGWAESSSEASRSGPVAVIGYPLWDQLFGRDPAVLGSVLKVDGVPVTIVGVVPERFKGVGAFARFKVWLPIRSGAVLGPEPNAWFRAAARLRAGVRPEAAEAAARVVATRYAREAEETGAKEPSVEVVPFLSANGDPMFERDVRVMSAGLGLLGLLVLLVTCTNASALLTGLGMARREEIAVRLSLGAGRRRVVRQLLTESALLACVAAAVSLGIVQVAFGVVARIFYDLPLDLHIDWTETAFTFGVALAVGVLFGLSPALHATRRALAGVLRAASSSIAGTRSRLQHGLVAAQVAFTQPLVVLLAALLIFTAASFKPMASSDSPDRVIEVRMRIASSSASADTAFWLQVGNASDRLVRRLEDTPGIVAAIAPFGGMVPSAYYAPRRATRPDARNPIRVDFRRVAPGYFRVMDLPLARGRAFGPEDMAIGRAQMPAIIGTDLAGRLWPGADPLGRTLEAASDSALVRSLVVVGVLDRALAQARSLGGGNRIYLPTDSATLPYGLLVRTAGSAAPFIPEVKEAFAEEMPTGVSVASALTLAQQAAERQRDLRRVVGGTSAAGLLALLLSAIGLYAVVSFSAGQRTREIAIRMALGGGRWRVVRRFVVEGLGVSAIGVAIGLPIGLVGLRVLKSALDFPPVPVPPIVAIASAGVLVVALAAIWVPVRRAASVEPAQTLHGE